MARQPKCPAAVSKDVELVLIMFDALQKSAIEVCKWKGWMRLRQGAGLSSVEALCDQLESILSKEIEEYT